MNALYNLRKKLEIAWCPETAAPGTSFSCPSAGQCAVTAIIIHDMFGGELISTKINGISHWFNRIKNDNAELDVDLTGDQFGFEPVQTALAGQLYSNTKARSMDEINPETWCRVNILKERMRKIS